MSGIMGSAVTGLHLNVSQHSHVENPLPDLISAPSNDPVFLVRAELEPVSDIGFKEHTLSSSTNLHPLPSYVDPFTCLNLQSSDQSLTQNPTHDAAIRREISLLDDDILNCPSQKDEKFGLGRSANEKSVAADITLAQPSRNNGSSQLEPLVIMEDVDNDISPGALSPSLVSPGIMDETISDVISPFASVVDSMIPDSELEVTFIDFTVFVSCVFSFVLNDFSFCV